MLLSVSKETNIPVTSLFVSLEPAGGVPALVSGYDCRNISNPPSLVDEALTKIDILKPNRIEQFVKSAHALPCVAAKQKKSASRLLNVPRLRVVQIEAAVLPADGIARKQTIQTDRLKN